MKQLSRLIFATALLISAIPAFAQAPAPVPALPDAERRTTYTISASTCACAVNFALFGDGSDYQNWVEVWLNGVRYNYNDSTNGWTITSPSGPIANLARPITNAVLTFTNAQTGTVQIVGARRPRRTSQFLENRGVAARDLNQVLTDLVAQNRETWDKLNDVTGRAVLAPPGETLSVLATLASRQNTGACWDSGGNLASCVSVPTSTIAAGSNITLTGTNPTTIAFSLGSLTIPNSNLATMAASTVKCNQTTSTAAPTDCTGQLPINAYQFGIKCDGSTDDGPGFTAAFNAINAGTIGQLVLPPGTCRIATNSFLNTWTAIAGTLTVPGVKIVGKGRGITKIDTAVANDYAISLNPAWAALHHSMFLMTAGTSGLLGTNTYYIKITVTDAGGNEVSVSPAKSVAVTGPSGSISIPLQATNAGYCYNVYIGTTSTPANYATVLGADAICKSAGTVVVTGTGTAHVVPTNKNAVWQEARLQDLSITNSTSAVNASGVLWFRVGYSTMSNVYMVGLTGDGLDIPNWTGDNDGSFVVTVDQSKFDSIAGTCINAAGNTLEFSNFTVSNSVFNICGTPASNLLSPITISSITNANPGVVTTASAHNLQAGDQVLIQSVAGMSLTTNNYRACGSVSGTTFSLCDLNNNNVNTTSLGAYTASSGNEKLSWRPPQMQTNGNGPSTSGAIAYTGLISTFINNGFTQNNNYDIYLTEAGSNDNVTMYGNDLENTNGKGVYAATVINLTWDNGECLTSSALGATVSCMQFGTGLNKGGAQNVQVNNIKVRSDVGLANGFEQLSGASALIYQNTISVKNVYWQTFSGLNKYIGFGGNPQTAFWARFDGKTGSTCTLKDSFNIASCVRNATGDYTLTFTTPLPDANYALIGSASNIGVGGATINANPATITTTSARFNCFNFTSASQDCDFVSITGFGNPN